MSSYQHGHRDRVKQHFLQSGFDCAKPQELLELLLFYAIPQKDVKPIAYALLRQFGSVSAVLSASIDELTAVSGVGEHSAKLFSSLRFLPDCLHISEEEMPPLDTPRMIAAYLAPRYENIEKDGIDAVLFNNKNQAFQVKSLSSELLYDEALWMQELLRSCYESNAAGVAVVFQRSAVIAMPTNEELAHARRLLSLLARASVSLHEILLFCGKQHRSLLQDIRAFSH